MLQVFLDCTVRSALIAAGAGVLFRLARIESPRARHVAWTGVVCAMLLLPAWTAWGPRFTARVLPVAAATPLPLADSGAAAPGPAILAWSGGAAPNSRIPWNWQLFLTAIYALGVSAMLGRLAIGTFRARALVRASEPRDGRLTNAACATPITVGWLRPKVILPAEWAAWPRTKLDAVLAHEGEHAHHRDPLTQWLALFNRAVFWFNPLAWWLERRIGALAEEASDAAVLSRGHNADEYAACLIAMARSVTDSGSRIHVIGMTMPGSALPARIRRILNARPARPLSRLQSACFAAACATLSCALASAGIDRQPLMTPPALALRARSPVLIDQPAPTPAPVRSKPHPRPALQIAQAQTAPAPPQSDGRMLILYFDWPSIDQELRSRTTAAARKFVETQTRPADRVSILAFGRNGIHVIQDFTTDQTKLFQAIEGQAAETVPAGTPNASAQMENLTTTVRMFAPVDGKKALIYFTTGFKPEGQENDAQLRSLTNAAIRANVAFYSIDSRGLVEPSKKQ